jgi:hypothetical protein
MRITPSLDSASDCLAPAGNALAAISEAMPDTISRRLSSVMREPVGFMVVSLYRFLIVTSLFTEVLPAWN